MKKIGLVIAAGLVANAAHAGKIKVDKDEYLDLKSRTQAIEKELHKLKKRVRVNSPKKLHNSTLNIQLPNFKAFVAVDKTLVNNDAQERPDASSLRYGRVSMSREIKDKVANMPDLRLKFEIDFGKKDTKVTDAYADIIFNKSSYVRIGQAKEPMSLAVLGSSKQVSLLERPAAVVFAPGRNTGLQYVRNTKLTQFAAGFFGDNVNDTASSSDETVSFTTRGVWLPKVPVIGAHVMTHLGASWRSSNPTASTASYNVKEANYSSAVGTADLTTGTLSNVRKVNTTGVELAFLNPRFTVSGEYLVNDLKRTNAEKLQFEGGYAQVNIAVNKPFIGYNYVSKTLSYDKDKARNAIELVYRHSYVDLTHLDIRKGGYTSNTVGINYHYNEYLKFLLNYVNAKTDSNATSAQNSPEIIALRTQFLF